MEKNITELKTELGCMCVREKKQQFFKVIRNVNVPFKKDFKFAELLTKPFFFLNLETILKMAKETN